MATRSLEHSATLSAEAASRLTSDQSTNAFPGSVARFCEKAIILNFRHKRNLEHRAALSAGAASGLTCPADILRRRCYTDYLGTAYGRGDHLFRLRSTRREVWLWCLSLVRRALSNNASDMIELILRLP
jgi:hypothetical protein